MVNLTRDENGKTRAFFAGWWLAARGRCTATGCRSWGGVHRGGEISSLDPFQGTRTQSTTNCRTPSRSSTPFTS